MLRTGPDGRLAAGAIAGGIGLDVALRGGLASAAATAWIAIAAAALLLGGRVQGPTARLLIGAAPVLGLLLTIRSSPWVVIPVAAAAGLLLMLGASLGADRGRLRATFPALITRLGLTVGQLAAAPGILRPRSPHGSGTLAWHKALATGRGILLGGPVLVIVGLLLASADPIFRSWFDVPAILQHALFIAMGAWLVAGLARAASAAQAVPAMRSSPMLGTLEASVVLGGLCCLYAAFVGAQFVGLSGAGHRILVTRGLTYAEYARAGFFNLLWCAAITLVVLLGVRGCSGACNRLLIALSLLTIALTLGVVVVAIRRLALYEAAFGLTMLRLACLVAAVWIGVVFLMLAASVLAHGLLSRWFPAAMLISALVLIAAWGAVNPAAIVASTGIQRAEHGQQLDVRQAASLGPDAAPALLAGLPELPAGQAAGLRAAVCAEFPGAPAGTRFNLDRLRASDAVARVCGAAR
jgi:two-component system sensor histidine kinase BaeS